MRSAVGDVNNKGVGAMSKGGWVGQRFREVHLEDVRWRFALFDRSWDKHCQATALSQFISLGIFQKYMLFFSKTFGWLVEMTRTCWDGLKTNQISISGSQIFPCSGPLFFWAQKKTTPQVDVRRQTMLILDLVSNTQDAIQQSFPAAGKLWKWAKWGSTWALSKHGMLYHPNLSRLNQHQHLWLSFSLRVQFCPIPTASHSYVLVAPISSKAYRNILIFSHPLEVKNPVFFLNFCRGELYGIIFCKYRSVAIGSMYAIYGNIYHQYTPNVSIYTIHGSYGIALTNFRILQVGTPPGVTCTASNWISSKIAETGSDGIGVSGPEE